MNEPWKNKKPPGIKTNIERTWGQWMTKLFPAKPSHAELKKKLDAKTRDRLYPPRISSKKKT